MRCEREEMKTEEGVIERGCERKEREGGVRESTGVQEGEVGEGE